MLTAKPRIDIDRLAETVNAHLRVAELADGSIVCRCSIVFPTTREYTEHAAEMVMALLQDLIERERHEAQIRLLVAAMRHWGPSGDGATVRSRTVYTGAQFAGWCREQAARLHRGHAKKPPTQTGNDPHGE